MEYHVVYVGQVSFFWSISMNVDLFKDHEVSGLSMRVATLIKSNIILLTVDRLEPGTTKVRT